ncbi:Oligopeptide transport ATP-binding protein OppD [archaeon HR01]|nr:Oligopeptide transport ATP-binding protein OppD [archaeon HR01]
MMVLLDVRNLTIHYMTERGVLRAVEDVSFQLEKGETMGLVGESGCGKTSIALAIMRTLPDNVCFSSGELLFDGEDILAIPAERYDQEIRWRKISMVFQGALNSFNPVLRIGFQVAEPLMQSRKISWDKARGEVARLFSMLGLPEETIWRYPHELSGGMKQRAMLAMALILRPKLVILDEPTSALDVSVQTQIMNLLKRLKRDMGLAMIFITHDITLASDICDRISVMYAGELVELGDADDVLTNPLHPYTRKLLAATPRLRGDRPPEYIPGSPPDLVNPPSGCRFHPRCPVMFDRCISVRPPMFSSGRVKVRCLLYG